MNSIHEETSPRASSSDVSTPRTSLRLFVCCSGGDRVRTRGSILLPVSRPGLSEYCIAALCVRGPGAAARARLMVDGGSVVAVSSLLRFSSRHVSVLSSGPNLPDLLRSPADSGLTATVRMVGRQGARMDEGLMMMQELEDRLKEQIDKLEHIRLTATDLKESLTGSSGDLRQSIAEHMDWLGQLTERVETLQMNTSVFVQMNAKPRTWRGKQQSFRSSARWGRGHVANDAQSEFGWSPVRTRRNSDAASEMSCAW
ncbi:hypothetical protein NFI96_010534 [Prochilodus magdalenae]|nr:hypothetical protein NFI96_010534 [Prochilodus magdalenae]